MGRANRLCSVAIPAAAISLAAMGAIAAPARSAPGQTAAGVTSLAIPGVLFGVAAASGSDAWAVGFVQGSTGILRTLLLRWNGTGWSQVTNPKPVEGVLTGVSIVSAADAWAVGWTETGSSDKTLVMHWNGTRWSVQAGAATIPGELYAVAARGNSVWAVGATHDLEDALILHWVGNRWYVVPSEAPAPARLYGVAVTGDSTAWAGGQYFPHGIRGLLLRWNGRLWKSVSSPLQGPNNFLNALAAGPAGAVWAVGADWNSTTTAATATSMLWNGKTWRAVPVGSFSGPVVVLDGVTFVPGGTAWAVGYNSTVSLLLRWTGHAWTPVANPGDSSDSSLYGVAATSVSNAWAVGSQEPGDQPETLIMHWNGKTWS